MTERYLRRPLDARIVQVIQRHVPSCDVILDLGCGSGVYGSALKQRCRRLIGLDADAELCAHVSSYGVYDEVVAGEIQRVAELVPPVDVVFGSEVLEHIANDEIRSLLGAIESICSRRLVITMPNPLSPHFRSDPTHVLGYSIHSFLDLLNERGDFAYRLLPLGFSEQHLRNPLLRALNVIARTVPLASPTVLYVGDRGPSQPRGPRTSAAGDETVESRSRRCSPRTAGSR